MTTLTTKDSKRFWAKVQKADGCWEWTGAKGKQGYGNFGAQRKTWRAPRVAWILTRGEIPEGMYVCHECNNPSCVNPDHLYLGSCKDNLDQMTVDGRRSRKGARGIRNRAALLNEKQVMEIRMRWAMGERAAALADEYGLSSKERIYEIVKGKSWKHLPLVVKPKNR